MKNKSIRNLVMAGLIVSVIAGVGIAKFANSSNIAPCLSAVNTLSTVVEGWDKRTQLVTDSVKVSEIEKSLKERNSLIAEVEKIVKGITEGNNPEGAREANLEDGTPVIVFNLEDFPGTEIVVVNNKTVRVQSTDKTICLQTLTEKCGVPVFVAKDITQGIDAINLQKQTSAGTIVDILNYKVEYGTSVSISSLDPVKSTIQQFFNANLLDNVLSVQNVVSDLQTNQVPVLCATGSKEFPVYAIFNSPEGNTEKREFLFVKNSNGKFDIVPVISRPIALLEALAENIEKLELIRNNQLDLYIEQVKTASTGKTIHIGPYMFRVMPKTVSDLMLKNISNEVDFIIDLLDGELLDINNINNNINAQKITGKLNNFLPVLTFLEEGAYIIIANGKDTNEQPILVILTKNTEGNFIPVVVGAVPFNFDQIARSFPEGSEAYNLYMKLWADTMFPMIELNIARDIKINAVDAVDIELNDYYQSVSNSQLFDIINKQPDSEQKIITAIRDNNNVSMDYCQFYVKTGKSAIVMTKDLKGKPEGLIIINFNADNEVSSIDVNETNNVPFILLRAIIAKLDAQGLSEQAELLTQYLQKQAEAIKTYEVDSLELNDYDVLDELITTGFFDILSNISKENKGSLIEEISELLSGTTPSEKLDVGAYTLNLNESTHILLEQKEGFIVPATIGQDKISVFMQINPETREIEIAKITAGIEELNEKTMADLRLIPKFQMPATELSETGIAGIKASSQGEEMFIQVFENKMQAVKQWTMNDIQGFIQATGVLTQKPAVEISSLNSGNEIMRKARQSTAEFISEEITPKVTAQAKQEFIKEKNHEYDNAVREYNSAVKDALSMDASIQKEAQKRQGWAQTMLATTTLINTSFDKEKIITSNVGNITARIRFDKKAFPNGQLGYANKTDMFPKIAEQLGQGVDVSTIDLEAGVKEEENNKNTIIITTSDMANTLRQRGVKTLIWAFDRAFETTEDNREELVRFFDISRAAKGFVLYSNIEDELMQKELFNEIGSIYKLFTGIRLDPSIANDLIASGIINTILPSTKVVYTQAEWRQIQSDIMFTIECA